MSGGIYLIRDGGGLAEMDAIISLSVLKDEAALRQILEMLDWFVREVKSHSNELKYHSA